MWTFDQINDWTGFANGSLFAEEREVRAYFTVATMESLNLGGYAPDSEAWLEQSELSAMADEVVSHNWHMIQSNQGRLV